MAMRIAAPSAGPAPARPARPTAAPSTVQRRHMAHRTSGSRTVRAISARIEDYEVILFTHDHALRLVVSHGDACLPALSAPVSGTSRRLQGLRPVPHLRPGAPVPAAGGKSASCVVRARVRIRFCLARRQADRDPIHHAVGEYADDLALTAASIADRCRSACSPRSIVGSRSVKSRSPVGPGAGQYGRWRAAKGENENARFGVRRGSALRGEEAGLPCRLVPRWGDPGQPRGNDGYIGSRRQGQSRHAHWRPAGR